MKKRPLNVISESFTKVYQKKKKKDSLENGDFVHQVTVTGY